MNTMMMRNLPHPHFHQCGTKVAPEVQLLVCPSERGSDHIGSLRGAGHDLDVQVSVAHQRVAHGALRGLVQPLCRGPVTLEWGRFVAAKLPEGSRHATALRPTCPSRCPASSPTSVENKSDYTLDRSAASRLDRRLCGLR